MLFEAWSSSELGLLKNRIAMAPMTRSFSSLDHRAATQAESYYGVRAESGAALILTEGIIVDPTGDGYLDVPYLCNSQQAESWKPIIDRVHKAESKIIAQLWHCGRISHEDFTGGVPPLSSMNEAAEGVNRQNNKPYGIPRAMETEEGAIVVRQFTDAARLACSVGFDGVEIHAGHGYLIDQFLDGNLNKRTDRYGGSVSNRCRLLFEIVESVTKVIASDKIIVRLSPRREVGPKTVEYAELHSMLTELAQGLWERGVRIVDISNAHARYAPNSGEIIRIFRPFWRGLIIGGASLSLEDAQQEVRSGMLDLVTWGRSFIANPDLAKKMQDHEPLKDFDRQMLQHMV